MRLQAAILALFIALTTVSAASAADLSRWDVGVQLNEDMTASWKVTLEYKEPVSHDDYWILAKVSSYSVFADGQPVACRKVPQEVGTSIICDDFRPAKNVVFEINTEEQVGIFDGFSIFRYAFPVTRFTDRFSVAVTLPLGSALVSAEQLRGTGLSPFSPSFGKEGTDGRRIFVTWDLQNPRLGETTNVSILFEPLAGTTTGAFALIVIASIAVLAIYFHYRKGRVRHILPVLTPGERAVMEVVMREKEADQKDIVKETDFSKAKVSRIVKGLEQRGLIDTQPKGRTKLIRLSSERRPAQKEEKPEAPKAEESRGEERERRKKEARQKAIIRKLLGKE